MAAIDRIYGTGKQRRELEAWLRANLPEGLEYLYSDFPDLPEHAERQIANFSVFIDRQLWEKCPLAWVRDRLSEQYGNRLDGWAREDLEFRDALKRLAGRRW